MKLIIDIDKKRVCEGFERNFTEEERSILIRAIGNGKPYEEKPQGKWHYYNNSNVNGYIHDGCKCREEVFNYAYNFCPNCGADMRGDDNG